MGRKSLKQNILDTQHEADRWGYETSPVNGPHPARVLPFEGPVP